MKKYFLIQIIVLISCFASAANKTSIASGNWSNPAIWLPAGVPATGDDVTISNANTVTLDIPTTVRSLTVTKQKTTFIINQPLTVTTGDINYHQGDLTAGDVITIINNSTLTILQGGIDMSDDALFYFQNNCTLIADKVVKKGLILSATWGNTFDNYGFMKIDFLNLSGTDVYKNHNTGYIITNTFSPSGTNVYFENSGTVWIKSNVIFSGPYTLHGATGIGTYGQYFVDGDAQRSGTFICAAGEHLDFCKSNHNAVSWSKKSGGNDFSTSCQNTCASYPLTAMVHSGCLSDTFPGIADACIGTSVTVAAHMPVGVAYMNLNLTASDFSWYATATGGSPLTGGSGTLTYQTGILTQDTAFYFGRTCGIQGFTRVRIPVTVKSCQLTVLVNASPQEVCAGSKVADTLSAHSLSGVPPYKEYDWATETPLGSGTYTTFQSGIDSVLLVLPTTITKYRVIVFDHSVPPSKTSDTNYVTITVHPLPNVTLGIQDSVCINKPAFKLTGGTVTPSQKGLGWYSGKGVSATDSITFNPLTAGANNNIEYHFIDTNKCRDSASGTVVVNALPVVNLPVPLPAQCIYNAPITLNQGTPANGKYYGDGIGVDSTIFNPKSLSYGAHQIVYKYTDAITHCMSSATSSITVNPRPVLNLQPTDSICQKQSITLTAGNEPNVMYIWSPTITSSSITLSPTKDSLIQVLAVNTLTNCINNDTINLKVNLLPIINITALPSIGCQPLTVDFTSTPAGAKSYFWNFGDPASNGNNISIGENPLPHVYKDSGQYTIRLTVTTNQNCTDSLRMDNLITIYHKPLANFYYTPLVPSSFNPLTTFRDNSSTDVIQWNWDFGDPTSNDNSSTIKNPEHSYSNYGDFLPTLIVQNTHCSDTIQIPLHVKADFTFYAPNAFTPNDDGVNDYFTPKGVGIDESSYEFFIYSRWGEEIFKSTDIQKGWGGVVVGSTNICEAGVYAWVARFKDKEGKTYIYRGLVTLVR